MRKVNLIQGSPEWASFRRLHLGASDIGTLMEGSEREVYDLMETKRGNKEVFVNDAMKRGANMEQEALEWLLCSPCPPESKVTAVHDKHDWLMASFDHIGEATKLLIEVKCPTRVYDSAVEQTNYKKWWWQCQAQMAVAGEDYTEALLLTYDPFKQVKTTIPRDKKAIAQLIKKGKEFADKLSSFEPLAPPAELTERSDEAAKDWANCYRLIDEKIKELEEQKKVLRDEGIALAGDEGFQIEGLKVQKIAARETIDYKAACSAHNIDLSKFTKRTENSYTWRISL